MNDSTLRLSKRFLAGGTTVLELTVIICCAPSVFAQESGGRGRTMAGGAEWVGAGVPSKSRIYGM